MATSKQQKGKKKQSLYRDYSLLSITILTVAFFIMFAIRPSLGIILSLNKEQSDYDVVNDNLEQKIQQIIRMQTSYITLLNKKFLIDEAVPNSHQVEEVAQLARASEVEIESFDIQKILVKPLEQKGLSTIPITISGSSSYKSLVDFIDRITSLPRLFRFKSLELENETAGTQSATIKFNTVIETYYYVE